MASQHDLAALRAIYAEVDAALDGWTCAQSTDCCHFSRNGEREPYLWANEFSLVEQALAARGQARPSRSLPVISSSKDGRDERRCPLLGTDDRCTIYAARPFGCRTYFCERGVGPTRRPPRARLAELGRAVATLAEREAPDGGGPRLLTRWLADPSRKHRR